MAMMLPILAEWSNTQKIVAWSVVLGAWIVAMFFVAVWVKRRMQRNDDATGGPGFTLDELRRLHRAGQLSEEQYARARSRVLEQWRSEPPPADNGDDDS